MDSHIPDINQMLMAIYFIENGAPDVTPEKHIKDSLNMARVSEWAIETIMTCSSGKQGLKLLHYNAVKTKSLNPPLNEVPEVRINNKHVPGGCMWNLFACLCEKYLPNVPECRDEEGKKV